MFEHALVGTLNVLPRHISQSQSQFGSVATWLFRAPPTKVVLWRGGSSKCYSDSLVENQFQSVSSEGGGQKANKSQPQDAFQIVSEMTTLCCQASFFLVQPSPWTRSRDRLWCSSTLATKRPLPLSPGWRTSWPLILMCRRKCTMKYCLSLAEMYVQRVGDLACLGLSSDKLPQCTYDPKPKFLLKFFSDATQAMLQGMSFAHTSGLFSRHTPELGLVPSALDNRIRLHESDFLGLFLFWPRKWPRCPLSVSDLWFTPEVKSSRQD